MLRTYDGLGPATVFRYVVRDAWLPRSAANVRARRPSTVSNHVPRTTYPFPPRTTHSGFTLIELLVVLTVISVLAALVTPTVFRNVGDAHRTAARAQIELLGLALEQYRLDNGWYPSTDQGLEALRTQPTGEPVARNWRGPYLRKPVPADPWARAYRYLSPGETNPKSYDLGSYGRDGRSGGEDEDADIGP